MTPIIFLIWWSVFRSWAWCDTRIGNWRCRLYRFPCFLAPLKGFLSCYYSGMYICPIKEKKNQIWKRNAMLYKVLQLWLYIGQSFSRKYGCCKDSTNAVSRARAPSVYLCRPWWCKCCILAGYYISTRLFITPSVSNYMSTFKKLHSLRKVNFEKKEV